MCKILLSRLIFAAAPPSIMPHHHGLTHLVQTSSLINRTNRHPLIETMGAFLRRRSFSPSLIYNSWLAVALRINAFVIIPRSYDVHRQRLDLLSSFTIPNSPIQNQDHEDTSNESVTTTPHKRRERYSGRYPKNFKDKYKERQGDEATISKVLAKGMTPAGQHVPIMVKECLHYMGLDDTNYQRHSSDPILVVDCTLGYGGHSSYILKQIMNHTDAKLIAFDRDSVEIQKTEERLRRTVLSDANHIANCKFTAVNQNFADLGPYMTSTNQNGKVTSLLADLGLSSMQIDNDERGFTYKRDGPLDMRMNQTNSLEGRSGSTETAYELLKRLRVRQLKAMLQENSDEEFADEIAYGLIGNGYKIPETTMELADRVRDVARPLIEKQNGWNSNGKQALGKNQAKKLKQQLDSTIARVMQAIRIEVNREFEVLEKLLEDLPNVLSPRGKVVILTFHSGEDRRVKKSFKSGFKSGIYSAWSRDVVRPTKEERRDNPRSSCCKLRWAVRSDQTAI